MFKAMAGLPTGIGRAVQGQSAVTFNAGQRTDIAIATEVITDLTCKQNRTAMDIDNIFTKEMLERKDVPDLMDATNSIIAHNEHILSAATCDDALRFAAFIVCSLNVGVSAPIN